MIFSLIFNRNSKKRFTMSDQILTQKIYHTPVIENLNVTIPWTFRLEKRPFSIAGFPNS